MNKIRQKTIKVVNIPLLFKNTPFEIKSPEKKIVTSHSTRNLSAKNIKKNEFTSSNKKFIPYQNTSFQNDIRRKAKENNNNSLIKTQAKKNISTSLLKNISKPKYSDKKSKKNATPERYVIIPIRKNKQQNNIQTNSTKYQQTTQRSHDNTENNNALQSFKDFEEDYQLDNNVLIPQSNKKMETQLIKLEDHFIKKRCEVYKVLSRLDSKFQLFEKSTRNKNNVLSQINTNSNFDRSRRLLNQKRISKNSSKILESTTIDKINSVYVNAYQVKKKCSKNQLFQQ